eukprot:2419631-Amphidinium_carterae.2
MTSRTIETAAKRPEILREHNLKSQVILTHLFLALTGIIFGNEFVDLLLLCCGPLYCVGTLTPVLAVSLLTSTIAMAAMRIQ